MLNFVSKLAAKYYSLGMALVLKSSALDQISTDNPKKSNDALQEVINKWLCRADLTKSAESITPSWRALAAAVYHPAGGGHPALAKDTTAAHPRQYNAIMIRHDQFE